MKMLGNFDTAANNALVGAIAEDMKLVLFLQRVVFDNGVVIG